MRIISGQLKGRKLFHPKDKKTRPLKDLVKESIFNIIHHSKKFNLKLESSNILDLFSGVGSFGIEALSRGANSVTFVENYSNVYEILIKNIKLNKLENKSVIINKNILNELNFKKIKQSFEIIFLDPPYKEELSSVISKIYESKILKKDGVLIMHRHSSQNDFFLKEFKIIEEKKYGLSKIIFGIFI